MVVLWGWKNGDFNGGFWLDFWGFGGWFFRGKILEMKKKKKIILFFFIKKKKNILKKKKKWKIKNNSTSWGQSS